MTLRVEHEQFRAGPLSERRQRLGGDGVQPAETVDTVDREHDPVLERRKRAPGDELTLLTCGRRHVRQPALVDDGTGNDGERALDGSRRVHLGHAHSARASRADACEPSSPPSAAMSQAQSR